MPKNPYWRKRDNPDPQRYIIVNTREGSFPRQKRGTKKPAGLNETLQNNADGTKLASPVAKRVRICLQEATRGLDTGRLQGNFTKLLRAAMQARGRFDFQGFAGYDFQQYHPLDSLLQARYDLEKKGDEIGVKIPLNREAVKQKNGLVTEYYFELWLVWGDAGKEDGLRVETVSSGLYAFGEKRKRTCALSLALPEGDVPWLLALKVGCLEGNELAHHPRHYGMKVVAVGGTSC